MAFETSVQIVAIFVHIDYYSRTGLSTSKTAAV